MIAMSLSQLADVCGGKLIGDDRQIVGVSTDTRQIEANDLFIALVGERFDAHQFIAKAIENGASAVLVEKQQSISQAQIVVDDTRIAMGQLAREVKRQAKVKTLAITGSCGKTTVKELCAQICQLAGTTLATNGNFNNDIGVPLTLFRLTEQDEYAVIELGANHIGEIAYTVSLTEPDVAMVNNVHGAHLEGFGSISGVAQAKGEIYHGLADNGLAVVNLDCPFVKQWQARLDKKSCLSFSLHNSAADIQAEDIQLNGIDGSDFTLRIHEQRFAVKLALAGEHNIANALAACAMTLAIGIKPELIVTGLQQETLVPGRMVQVKVNDQLLVIDDTYNANVSAMKAALDVLATCEGSRIFVMGDMGELGDYVRSAHQEVGDYARKKQIDVIYSVGEWSAQAQTPANMHTHHFHQQSALWPTLQQTIANAGQKVTVLVKGSRSAKMEQVVEQIQQEFSTVGGSH